jgi:hypothetical protein
MLGWIFYLLNASFLINKKFTFEYNISSETTKGFGNYFCSAPQLFSHDAKGMPATHL